MPDPTPPADPTPANPPAKPPAADPAPAVDPVPGPAPADDDAIRKAVLAEFNERLKTVSGADSLDALEDKRKADEAESLKAQGKWQELAESNGKDSDKYKGLYHRSRIDAAIATAAGQSVDPGTVQQLLASQAMVGDDGRVTIGGKPVADAVAGLLKDKPFLARASGGAGGGSPGGGGDAQAQASADYDAAKKSGNVAGMLAAKNKLAGA